MNFWLLTTEYPPQSGGGISTYCYHTARMMAQKGHQVFVFVPSNCIKKLEITQQDTDIKILSYPVEDLPFLGYEAALSFTLSNVLKSTAEQFGDPDFIEAQEYNGLAYYSLQRKWLEKGYLEKSSFFVTAHAPGFLYLDYNQAPTHKLPAFWTGEMERSVLTTADFVISPSQYLLDILNINVSSQRQVVVHNPFESLKSTPSTSHTTGDIVFFGKLTAQKGALKLLEYLEVEWKKGAKYRLSVIGGGDHYFYPLMMDMGQYVKYKYSNRIKEGLLKFEGHIAPEDINTRLAKAHVVVVPSIVDNLPYTVVEAMNLGKIVLASVDGGHKELIERGRTGYLFDHNKNGDFIHQLDAILSLENQDIINIGQEAQKAIITKCSYEVVYKQKMDVLNKLKSPTKHIFPVVRPRSKTKVSHTLPIDTGKLSVIIPYYNMGEYVDEAINSIIENKLTNYEIILVNDGSTDKKSQDKLLELDGRVEHLTIHNKENTGLSNTRNIGAKMAKGEYLAFLDPDDFIEPDYYSKALYILNKYSNISFVGCWAQYFGMKNYIWPAFNPEPPYILAHNMINSSALIMKKDDFLNFGTNDPTFIYGMEDYDSVISMVKNGCVGVVLPECLWNYRIRKNSLAQSFNKYSKEYLYRLLTRKHAEFYAEYAEEVINLMNSNGSSINYDNPSKRLGFFHDINVPFKNSKWVERAKTNKFLRNIAKIILKYMSR
ncbi:MAG TPA: glycosyltransferase [Fulvivirga sp.]|nr:glycosyltransferase [Fulvivirga sp.]